MKRRFDRTLRVLIGLNLLVVALLAGTMVADWMRLIPARGPGGVVDPSSSPFASIDLMQMGLAHIPTSNDCLLCHDKGGSSGVKPVPAIGHPLAGWTACLTCHTGDKLGREAPGHTGIAQTECTSCHKEAQAGPAITQAHAELSEPCLDCHGKVAHLPTSMVGRNEDDCWLCHTPNPSPPPIKPHPDPQSLSCRACHQASDAGSLPIDHALRADSTCVLCHDIAKSISPASPAPSASTPGG